MTRFNWRFLLYPYIQHQTNAGVDSGDATRWSSIIRWCQVED